MALYYNYKTDRRAELLDLAQDENIKLPLSVDLILWLEDREWVVDLLTGQASRVDGSTLTIRLLSDDECEAEALDYEEGRLDEEWHSRGSW